MFLSFADVMCFFISVYLLIRVSEKCQNILLLLLKRRKILDFHRCGIPSYFSFPKQSFIAPHTIISEVCFNNREFFLCLLGVTLTVILGIILNFLSTFLHFLSTFSVHHLHNLTYLFIVLGFTLGFVLGFTQSFGVHIIVLPFYSIKNGKCENITLF